MAGDRLTRRLAAIAAADVVGYSRMMEADEAGTLARLKTLRREVFDPLTTRYGGRIFKNTGDGALTEFPSAVDAVECLMAIQQILGERNASLPEDGRFQLRVGISLGDVIVEDDDLYGNGVNVAARMEALAEVGGICVSGNVHEHVVGSLDLDFEDVGLQAVKNIDRPVQAYRLNFQGSGLAMSGGTAATEPAAPLALPEKPSIAVLPFENLSGDPEQDYFAEGIAEDIITAISRIGWLFVIARNSSFAFKAGKPGPAEIGRRLGVRYLLDGSVRKAGERVRISVRLLEADGEAHLWADRYDGPLDDIFDLQDQITESVIGAIEPELRSTEIARSRRKPPESTSAYDLLLRALPHVAAMTQTDSDAAMALLDQALALDPNYAQALGYAAWCRAFRPTQGWSTLPEDDLLGASAFVDRALQIDPDDPIVLRSAALAAVLTRRDYDTSLDLADKSLAVDPNSALTWGTRGYINLYADRRNMALDDFDRAMRLSPYDSWEYMYANGKSFVLNCEGRLEEGLRWARRAVQLNPNFLGCQRHLIAALYLLGEAEEATRLARAHQELLPNFTMSRWLAATPFRRTPDQERTFDAMRAAGLPD